MLIRREYVRILEANVLESTWSEGGKETETCSCIIESFRYSVSVVDHSTPNTSDPRLYSLSEIKATIILGITCVCQSWPFIHPRWGNAPVEIVEEGQQIEPKFYETLLLVPGQRPENFCCIVHVVFIADPVRMRCSP